MICLPDSCLVNKRIPKSKFYDKLKIKQAVKRNFIEQVDNIVWAYKISSTTLNIDEGKKVKEIEVFSIYLKSDNLDESVLSQIDKGIPYNILFLLIKESKEKAAICYKEKSNIGQYFYSDWYDNKINLFNFSQSTTDDIYEYLIRYLAGDFLNKINQHLNVKESLQLAKKRDNINKEISLLQKQLRKEHQFNKQVLINDQIKKLRKDLINL